MAKDNQGKVEKGKKHNAISQPSEATKAQLRKYLSLWDSWPNGGTFPGLRNGDELAEEYINLVREMVGEAE